MNERNILLTALGSMDDRTNHRYFYIKGGKKTQYCDAVSVAEAGAKYILSRENIDEIIVLGTGATYKDGDELRHIELRKFRDYDAGDTDALSEYSFFRYRLSEYLDDLDLEGSDIYEDIEPEHKDELIALYNDFAEKCMPKDAESDERRDRLFHLLTTDRHRYEKLISSLPAATRRKDMIWLHRYIYNRLEDDFKLTALPENDDLEICFVPTTNQRINMMPVENIAQIVRALEHGEADRVNLYIDMQGAGITSGNALIQVLSMISEYDSDWLVIREIISTHYDADSFASPIDNTGMRSYSLNQMVSGMKAFIQYGKVDTLKEYWESRNIRNERIELLLYGMKCVDDGISLCSITDLEYGIRLLRKIFAETPREDLPEMESNIFALMEEIIRSDYGSLLDSDEIDSLALVKWAFRKHFYQQCLTIIESRTAVDIVRKGLLYYAVDETSKIAMMEDLAREYFDTPVKNRWSFDDIDHYFIKYYGRETINPKQSAEAKAIQYTEARVESVFHGKEGMIKAYSELRHRPDLLQQALDAYYQIAPLRNSINHAEVKADLTGRSLDNIDIHRENERLVTLTEAIRNFIDTFDAALEARQPYKEPVLIEGGEFKDYIRSGQGENR